MKINALDNSGKAKEYDVILTYYSDKYNKNYIVYTDNTYNDKDELNIYINEYTDNPEMISKPIQDKEEYTKVKTAVNELLLIMKNESDKLEDK